MQYNNIVNPAIPALLIGQPLPAHTNPIGYVTAIPANQHSDYNFLQLTPRTIETEEIYFKGPRTWILGDGTWYLAIFKTKMNFYEPDQFDVSVESLHIHLPYYLTAYIDLFNNVIADNWPELYTHITLQHSCKIRFTFYIESSDEEGEEIPFRPRHITFHSQNSFTNLTMQDILAWLISLERLSGGKPVIPLFDPGKSGEEGKTFIARIDISYLISNFNLATSIRGGCNSNKEHINTIMLSKNNEKIYVKVLNVESRNNTCGIECIRKVLTSNEIIIETNRYFRKLLKIPTNCLLSVHNLQSIADVVKINLTIYDENITKILEFNKYPDKLHISLLLYKEHYTLIKEMVTRCKCGEPAFLGHPCIQEIQCPACHMYLDKKKHICPMSDTAVTARRMLREKIQQYSNYSENSSFIQDVIHCLFFQKLPCMIIGPAGTGKTFKILNAINKYCQDNYEEDSIMVCGSTGASSSLIEGATTLHYAFSLSVVTSDSDGMGITDFNYQRIQQCIILIIDEVSMLTGAVIDRLDLLCRRVRGRPNQSFGGILVCFIGDPLQLPPVQSTDYFFDSHILKSLMEFKPSQINIFYTLENVRYTNLVWYHDLLLFRIGCPSESALERLNKRYMEEHKIPEHITRLYTKNNDVNNYNNLIMAKMVDIPYQNFGSTDFYQYQYDKLDDIAPQYLHLKIGCKVMLTINHPYMEVYGVGNGSLGILKATQVNPDNNEIELIINFNKINKDVTIIKHTYFLGDTSSSYRVQFPIILAHALTVHKAQGQTFEELAICCNNIFEKSQLYVALSRCKNIDDVYLFGREAKRPDFKVHTRCLLFADETSEKPIAVPDYQGENFDDYNAFQTMSVNLRKYNMGVDNEYTSKHIYFDAETYADFNQGNILKCYCIEVIQYSSGKEFRHTFGKRANRDTDILNEFVKWLWELIIIDVENYKKHSHTNGIMKGYFAKPITLVAYNGARFDFHPVLQRLLTQYFSSDYRVACIFKQNTIAYFEINNKIISKKCLVFWDPYRILNCSLASASESFLGENIKGIFPHRLINIEGYNVTFEEKQPIKLDRMSFYPNQLMELDSIDSKNKLWNSLFLTEDPIYENGKFISCNADLFTTSKTYCFRDVEILVKLSNALDVLFKEVLQSSVFRFFSACQVAKFGVIKFLPKEVIIEKDQNMIVSSLFKYSRVEEDFIAQSVYGGRVLVRKDHFESSLKTTTYPTFDQIPHLDAKIMLDVVSMYGSIMKNRKFAYGKPYWDVPEKYVFLLKPPPNIYEDLLDGKYGHFIATIECEGNKFDVEPPVPYRTKGKIFWDTALREATYNHIDIALIIRNGGKIHKVITILAWPKTCTAKVFEKWIEKTQALKEEGEAKNQPAKKALGKLLANAAFGAYCQKSYNNITSIAESEYEMDTFLQTHVVEGMNPLRYGAMLMWGYKKDQPELMKDEDDFSATTVNLGSEILAYSRVIVDEFVHLCNPSRQLLMNEGVFTPSGILYEALHNMPMYGDTDSLILNVSQIPLIKQILGKHFGNWCDDLNKDFINSSFIIPGLITGVWIIAPKCYCISYILPVIEHNRAVYDPAKTKYKFRFKGVPYGSRINMYDPQENLLEQEQMCCKTFIKLFEAYKNGNKSEAMLNTIRKIGPHISGHDKIDGRRVFDLIQIETQKELFKTPWQGRKPISYNNLQCTLPISFPCFWNDVLDLQNINECDVSFFDDL